MAKVFSKKLIVFSYIIALTGGCRNLEKEEPIDINVIDREGTSIEYLRCGKSDTVLLFVHGWCIDKTYWANQLNYFCSSYEIIAIDLPGHGNSVSRRNNWTVEEYGEDVAAVIEQLDLNQVILIGHSMGGDIILEAAKRRPDAVIGLIGIDNFKDVGIEYDDNTLSQIKSFFELLKEDFANVAASYAQSALFSPSTDSSVIRRVLNDFRTANAIPAISALEHVFDYNEAENLSAIKCGLYLLNSDESPTNMEALERLGIPVQLFEIKGTGHYPMIEKPEDFNSLLEGVIPRIDRNK